MVVLVAEALPKTERIPPSRHNPDEGTQKFRTRIRSKAFFRRGGKTLFRGKYGNSETNSAPEAAVCELCLQLSVGWPPDPVKGTNNMAVEDLRKESRLLLMSAVLGLLLIHPPFADSEWYSGGTLHRATVGEWRSAPRRDKLATAADWALAHDRVKNKVMRSGSMQTLRPFAADLVACVDSAAGSSGNNSLRVSRLAASCMVLLGWQT